MKTFSGKYHFLLILLLLIWTACNNADTGSKTNNLSDSSHAGNTADIPLPPVDHTSIDPEDTITVEGGESVDPADEKDSVTYCHITKFYSRDGREYLDADFIQFYTGDKAIQAARKYGEVEKRVVNGDTIYSLPDDIYIRNDNPRIRSLAIDENAVYKVLRNTKSSVVNVAALREKLLARYSKEKIYVLTINKNNVITQIKEQYLP
jgi:hypothetical protein